MVFFAAFAHRRLVLHPSKDPRWSVLAQMMMDEEKRLEGREGASIYVDFELFVKRPAGTACCILLIGSQISRVLYVHIHICICTFMYTAGIKKK